MMNTEMRNTVYAIYDEINTDENLTLEEVDRMTCARCPYADRCHAENLFYGCIVWEDEQDADL